MQSGYGQGGYCHGGGYSSSIERRGLALHGRVDVFPDSRESNASGCPMVAIKVVLPSSVVSESFRGELLDVIQQFVESKTPEAQVDLQIKAMEESLTARIGEVADQFDKGIAKLERARGVEPARKRQKAAAEGSSSPLKGGPPSAVSVGAGKVLEAMLCRNLGLDSITNLSVVQLRKLAKFFEVVLPHEASEHSNDASKFRANVDIILGAAQGSMHVPSKKELGCIRIKK